ncbi:MAG: esterase-like activity of phytase family protein [Richelia sp.]|nr:esterase-like activity of phytase family protein [Richelia sp.]
MKPMKKIRSITKTIYFLLPIIIIGAVLLNTPLSATEITGIEFIGSATLPTGLKFENTELGGLSGITYDANNDLYYAISDDRSQKSPARFYTLKIDLSKNGKLTDQGVQPVGVTTLLNAKGKSFANRTIDGEGIALSNNGSIYVSSEGDVGQSIKPFIKEFALASGKELNSLPIPNKFLPSRDGKQGIRNNLAFESLTITPNQKNLFTASENALVQDGTEAKPKTSTSCRILQYNLQTKKPEKEFLYQTEPVRPILNISRLFASGLPDLLALSNHGDLLSIERSLTSLGFSLKIYQVSLKEGTDISSVDSLLKTKSQGIKPVKKKLLFDLRKLKVLLDNIEGLTFGPNLSQGDRSLILVSDNNFQTIQKTQILAFRLKMESPLLRLLRRLDLR